jgi:ubiquinone/menaquinone biosynthesis C-methylase UbiE
MKSISMAPEPDRSKGPKTRSATELEKRPDADKAFYDQELMDGQLERFVGYVKPWVPSWMVELRKEFQERTDVRVLDLGAGSCCISLMLTEQPFVQSVTAADISAHRMRRLSPEVQAMVGGKLERLEYIEVNFNSPLPFPDNKFDVVVMDAALHHSRNIWETLAELRRVLKPRGLFIAQREAFTAPLTNRITFKRLLASPEVAAGVSENAYLRYQYDYYLRVNGFEPRFIPVFESWKFRILFFLNGVVFSKYNIVARSTKEV